MLVLKQLSRWKYITVIFLFSCFPFSAFTSSSYNIGGDTSGGFGLISEFFQKYVDFMTGPFSKAALASSLIIGVVVWAIMPKHISSMR